MQRIIALTISCLCLGAGIAVGQENTPPAQERFVGTWINADDHLRDLKRLEITKTDGTWQIEPWTGHTGSENSAGKAKLSLLGEHYSAKELPYGLATLQQGKEAVLYMILRLEKDELVAEFYKILSDDQKKGPNVRKVVRFKKA